MSQTEEPILNAAETILKDRLVRQGEISITRG
jgi:hypothetical protein